MDPDLSSRSVYVSGLAWVTTEDALKQHFSQVGNVKNVVILQKKRGGKILSMGCGIVEFESSEEALRAITLLNDSYLDERMIKCREDRPVIGSEGVEKSQDASESSGTKGAVGDSSISVGGERRIPEEKKVFVSSLPWGITADDLKDLFSAVGEVADVSLLVTKKGRSLGQAVVEFVDSSSSNEAIQRLNHQVIDGRPMIVREYFHN